MVDAEKIRHGGVGLLEEFSKALEKVPDTSETHYVVDLKNVWRDDTKPTCQKGFRDKLEKIAPKMEEGYVVAEKAK
jgi:predicted Asp-tRNA(Asn)/Glu-tRNA(Gln) amidotransferase subunit C